MANDSRTPGKYGRLAPDPEQKVLTLEKYLDPRAPLKAGGLPAVDLTQDVDRAREVTDWARASVRGAEQVRQRH